VDGRNKDQGKNGESIAFAADSRAYFTVSEGKEETICRFELVTVD
jgi:hypothetical protein